MVDTRRRMSNCKQITESTLLEKEDIFGRYIASELKLIKSQKVYEEVKWEILNTLQQAINSQSDSEENEAWQGVLPDDWYSYKFSATGFDEL